MKEGQEDLLLNIIKLDTHVVHFRRRPSRRSPSEIIKLDTHVVHLKKKVVKNDPL
jgi:hypothetical protein